MNVCNRWIPCPWKSVLPTRTSSSASQHQGGMWDGEWNYTSVRIWTDLHMNLRQRVHVSNVHDHVRMIVPLCLHEHVYVRVNARTQVSVSGCTHTYPCPYMNVWQCILLRERYYWYIYIYIHITNIYICVLACLQERGILPGGEWLGIHEHSDAGLVWRNSYRQRQPILTYIIIIMFTNIIITISITTPINISLSRREEEPCACHEHGRRGKACCY